MERSEAINELSASIAKSQAEMENPALDRMNPFFKARYASLAAVRNAVIPIFAKNGIAVLQFLSAVPADVPVSILCTTQLLHSSGQWLSSGLSLPLTKKDAQGIAALATYARRISLQAIAGVVGEEDDDGNSGNTTGKKPEAKTTVPEENRSAEQKATKEAFNKAIDNPSPAGIQTPPATPGPAGNQGTIGGTEPPPEKTEESPRNPNCILPAQEKLIRSRIGKDFAKSDVERITNDLKKSMGVEHLKDLLKTQMNAVMQWINTSAAELKEYTEELRKEEIEAAKTQS